MEERARTALVLAFGLLVVLVGVGPATWSPGSLEAAALGPGTGRALAGEGRAGGVRVEGPESSVGRHEVLVPARDSQGRGTGVEPVPSERSCSLEVRVLSGGRAVEGLAVDLHQVPDDPPRLEDLGDGRYRSGPRHPGFAVLRISTPAGPLERQVVLRPTVSHVVELDLAGGREVRGRVTDEEGEPLAGASVRIDGATATTDLEGRFVHRTAASGETHGVVRAEGFAPVRLPVPGGELSCRLERACAVELHLEAGPGGAGPVTWVLVPERRGPARYPWVERGPLTGLPGSTLRLDDLPSGDLIVLALGREHRASASLTLDVEGAASAVLRLAPEPARRPTRGDPVRRAADRLGRQADLLYERPLASLGR